MLFQLIRHRIYIRSQAAPSAVWVAEVDVVEGVEELRPEFNRVIFVELGGFVQREVEVLESGPDHRVPPEITKTVLRCTCAECNRILVVAWGEGLGVEPLIRCPRPGVRVLSGKKAGVLTHASGSDVSRIPVYKNAVGEAAVEADDRVNVPPLKHFPCRPVQVQVASSWPEG